MVYDVGMRETAGEMAERPNAGGLSTDLGAQAPRGFESHSLRPHDFEELAERWDLRAEQLADEVRRYGHVADSAACEAFEICAEELRAILAQTRTEAPEGAPAQTDYQPGTV